MRQGFDQNVQYSDIEDGGRSKGHKRLLQQQILQNINLLEELGGVPIKPKKPLSPLFKFYQNNAKRLFHLYGENFKPILLRLYQQIPQLERRQMTILYNWQKQEYSEQLNKYKIDNKVVLELEKLIKKQQAQLNLINI